MNTETLKQLINQAQDLIAFAEQIQSEAHPLEKSEREDKLTELSEKYRKWYRKSLSLFSAYDRMELEEPFMKECEGSWISQKIKRFLEAGSKIYVYYSPGAAAELFRYTAYLEEVAHW